MVTCPWHGWTFDACTGCSLDPAGNDVARYPVLVEEGNVYLKPKTAAAPSGRLHTEQFHAAPRRARAW